MRIGIEAQRIQRAKKHGMDVVAVELIKALQTIDKQNEYFIFCRNGEDAKAIQDSANFHIKSFPAFTYGDWEQIKLPSIAKKYDLDLLHCTANTGPLKCSIPLVLTLHDIIYLESLDFKGTMYQNAGNLYRKMVVPKLVKKSQLIITVSQFEKEKIVSRLQLPTEKVKVVYNAVSEKFNNNYSPESIKALKRQYNLPDEFILFLGNTAPKKNTSNVIKAYTEYCLANYTAIPLVLLDYNKELVEAFLKEIKQEKLLQNFVFPGYVKHDQMPLMYNAATLFLYPSLRESFGLPILEGMACGVPVVTSTTSSMPEVAGDAAVLVDPYSPAAIAEGISNILSDKEKWNNLKYRGLERAKLFTWKEAAKSVLSIYESCKVRSNVI